MSFLFDRQPNNRSRIVENSQIIQFYLIVKFFSSNPHQSVFCFPSTDLAGCADGSVYLLNWSQENSQRQLREPGKRITKIELSNEGNKVTNIA